MSGFDLLSRSYFSHLCFTFGFDSAAWILQGHPEIVIATHLHSQFVEINIRRFDRWRLLPVEERDLNDRQVGCVGEQVPGFAGVAGVLRVGQGTG